MKLTTHFSLFLYPLVLLAVLADVACFFLANGQITFFALSLFCLHLLTPISVGRLGVLMAAVCLETFIFYTALFWPLAYLLPSALLTHKVHGHLYPKSWLPLVLLSACLAAHYGVFSGQIGHFLARPGCCLGWLCAILGSAWMISLTLRDTGGRGNRSRP